MRRKGGGKLREKKAIKFPCKHISTLSHSLCGIPRTQREMKREYEQTQQVERHYGKNEKQIKYMWTDQQRWMRNGESSESDYGKGAGGMGVETSMTGRGPPDKWRPIKFRRGTVALLFFYSSSTSLYCSFQHLYAKAERAHTAHWLSLTTCQRCSCHCFYSKRVNGELLN